MPKATATHWVTREKEVIAVTDMTTAHLIRWVKYFRKKTVDKTVNDFGLGPPTNAIADHFLRETMVTGPAIYDELRKRGIDLYADPDLNLSAALDAIMHPPSGVVPMIYCGTATGFNGKPVTGDVWHTPNYVDIGTFENYTIAYTNASGKPVSYTHDGSNVQILPSGVTAEIQVDWSKLQEQVSEKQRKAKLRKQHLKEKEAAKQRAAELKARAAFLAPGPVKRKIRVD